MLTNTTLARIQALARSSFYPDLQAFLDDIRQTSVSDLLTATEMAKVYRMQGKVNAIDMMASNLEHLRNGEDIDDTQQDNVAVVIPETR